MRILLLSNLYPPFVEGGAEILAEQIAKGLEGRGHEVIVVTSHTLHPTVHTVPQTASMKAHPSSTQPHSPLRGSISRVMSHTPHPRATIKAHPSSTQPPSPLHWENEHVRRMLDYRPTVHFDWRGSLWGQLMKPFRFYRRYHNAGNARRLREVIKATSPDMVYVWEITGIGANSMLKVLHELHMPIVFHVGSYWWLYARDPETEQSRLHMRWFKRLLIGQVPELRWTSMIAVSEAVKEEYVSAGFDAERIEVIYNGIDQRFLASPRVECHEDKACHLLYVGRIRAEKGIMVMLKALSLLAHDLNGTAQVNEANDSDFGRELSDSEKLPLRFSQGFGSRTQHDNVIPIRLHIIGDGDRTYIRELKDFLKEHRLEEMVVFHGKVPQNELIGYYDCSQMLLVPSIWQEPFGMVVVEGMARGLPVIASNVAGLWEIISHERNGMLVDVGDERALAQAIRELMLDTDKRKRMGETGRTTVEERFMIEESVRKVEGHLLRGL